MQEKMTSKRKTGGDGDTSTSKRVQYQNAALSQSQKSTIEAETEAQVYVGFQTLKKWGPLSKMH
jgi:hypothetical protein